MIEYITNLFKPNWEIREEMMGGRKYWMIYRRGIFFSHFYERWNTNESAIIRLEELNNNK